MGKLTEAMKAMIASQQSFAESDFDVMGVEQAVPLQFPKATL